MKKLLFPQPYLPYGSKGPAVMVLQLMLKLMGYNFDKLITDGDYGDETKTAVQLFQSDYNLEEDGDFGPDTRAIFFRETGIDVNEIPALVGETSIPDSKPKS